jgi:hypothetical protein
MTPKQTMTIANTAETKKIDGTARLVNNKGEKLNN